MLQVLFGIPFGNVAFLPWDPWWLREPRRGWLAGFNGRVQEVGTQGHLNHLNISLARWNSHRLNLCLLSFGYGFGFPSLCDSDIPGVTRRRRNWNSETHLVIVQCDLYSGSWVSCVAVHLSFLVPFSRRVADLCRWLISTLRAVSLLTCHCLRNRFSRLSHPEYQGVSGAAGSRHSGDSWEWEMPQPS
jgi:hypothetical protein